MTEASELSRETLDRLQRLRVSVLTFRNEVAPLPADGQSNARNEQFNQLRLEAKVILKDRDFDKRIPRAVTADVIAERSQKIIIPRLSAIVILGVILALLGLGVNSVILEDFVINSLGCLISTGGMLLIIGAFIVLGLTNLRQQKSLTSFGNLYQHCQVLLYEINHTLNMDIPDVGDRPAADIPEIPSTVELKLDSLYKQVDDWQQKLRGIEEQRLSLGANVPIELTINIDFIQRELNRVRQEIDRLRGRMEILTEAQTEKEIPE